MEFENYELKADCTPVNISGELFGAFIYDINNKLGLITPSLSELY